MKNFILLFIFTFSIGYLTAQIPSVISDKKSKILIHHYELIVKNNGRFYLSANCSKARGDASRYKEQTYRICPIDCIAPMVS